MPESRLNPELRDHLEQLATDCRFLLEEAKPRMRNLPSLKDFPDGSCGDASLVLAWYLHKNGISEPITYVHSNKRRSHAWLEVGGWLLDITADQQSWGNPPVWILPITQSPFHQKHEPANRRDAALEKQDINTRSWIKQALAQLRPDVLQSPAKPRSFQPDP